jgi:hypothetical protein
VQNLTRFELVKVADIMRETHDDPVALTKALSDYILSWEGQPDVQAKLREDLQALLKSTD